MPRSPAIEQRMDDEDRFFGHLATFVVLMMMFSLMSYSMAFAKSWLVGVFLVWGALIARHAFRVFVRVRA